VGLAVSHVNRGGRDWPVRLRVVTRGGLGAAVHRHSLVRLNAITAADFLIIKKRGGRGIYQLQSRRAIILGKFWVHTGTYLVDR